LIFLDIGVQPLCIRQQERQATGQVERRRPRPAKSDKRGKKRPALRRCNGDPKHINTITFQRIKLDTYTWPKACEGPAE
jgi:hypothetical protein